MQKKRMLGILVLFLLVFTTGFLFGKKNDITPKTKGENSFQAGWEAAKTRLSETGYYPTPMEGLEINSISGKIVKIEGKKLFVKINPLEPLADPELDERIVLITDTRLKKMEEKSQEVIQREMEDHQREMLQSSEIPTETAILAMPPEMYLEKEADFSELKENMTIQIKSNMDIKNLKEFNASEITFWQYSNPAAL